MLLQISVQDIGQLPYFEVRQHPWHGPWNAKGGFHGPGTRLRVTTTALLGLLVAEAVELAVVYAAYERVPLVGREAED
jgi:hypothetical protein